MELKDLEGFHVLDGVDYEWEGERNIMRFRLNGVIYVAVEDPDDGYRSHLRDIRIEDPGASPMVNTFEGIPVYAVPGPTFDSNGDSHETLEIRCVGTHEVVIEVGTRNTGDYYPSCVMNFNPAAMAVNKEREDER